MRGGSPSSPLPEALKSFAVDNGNFKAPPSHSTTLAPSLVIIGSYTDTSLLAHRPKGNVGCGIRAFKLDSNSGTLSEIHTPDLGLTNPAFVMRHPQLQGVLYATTERIDKDGEIVTLGLGKAGELSVLGRSSALGKSTCYLEVNNTQEYVVAVNYWDAKLSTLAVDGQGRIGDSVEVQMQPGAEYVTKNEPTRDEHWQFRQRWPHTHCVVTEPYERKYTFVNDLGKDTVLVYAMSATGRLVHKETVQLPAGRGPRHLVFHPRIRVAYIVNELDSSVSALRYSDLTLENADASVEDAVPTSCLEELCHISTLPSGSQGQGFITPDGAWKAHSHTSEIKLSPDGNYLYVANRGDDSLAVYAVDPCTGNLNRVTILSSGGACPRHFNFSPCGRFLIVGNQDSNNLTVFSLENAPESYKVVHVAENVGSPNFVYAGSFPQ